MPPVRQKLVGLTKGLLSAELDSVRFGSLGVKDGCRFTMVGTPEELSFKDPSEVKLPDVRGEGEDWSLCGCGADHGCGGAD